MRDPNQTFFAGIDMVTFCLYLALVAIGGLFIFSVDVQQQGVPTDMAGFLTTQAGKQVIWIIISLLFFGFIVLFIDYKFWQAFAYLIYGLGIILLIAVVIVGSEIKGATSWFVFGGFSFQPSEVAKFGACLALASYLSHWSTNLKYLRTQVFAFAHFLAPAALVLLQPDMGSALVFTSFSIVLFREGLSPLLYILAICSAATLILGILVAPLQLITALIWVALLVYAMYQRKFRGRWVLLSLAIAAALWWLIPQPKFLLPTLGVMAALFLIASFLLVQQRHRQMVGFITIALILASGLAATANYAFNNVLKPHQQDRINVWLRPSECDPRGSLYNVTQSKMAISAGGWTGRGFMGGNLTKGNYVPEQATDFIFCSIGEEQGFLGSAAVIILFMLLLYRITIIAERQRSNFSRVYAYGVVSILFIHVVVNIGMTMGLLPIIGIPLPFISKGGSSLLGFTIMLAVLLKLDKHRGRIKLVNFRPA